MCSPFKSKTEKPVSVTINFLDNQASTFEVDVESDGVILLDLACKHVNVEEFSYFGLLIEENEDFTEPHWLLLQTTIAKQVKNFESPLSFRVRFYPIYPLSNLEGDLTFHQFYLQAKRDIIENRLKIQNDDGIVESLFSCILQLEPNTDLVSELKIAWKEPEKIIAAVQKLQENLSGLEPKMVKCRILDQVSELVLYGTKIYKAMDATGKELHLGITPNLELIQIEDDQKVRTFPDHSKIKYVRRNMFGRDLTQQMKGYDIMLYFKSEEIRTTINMIREYFQMFLFLKSRSPLASGR